MVALAMSYTWKTREWLAQQSGRSMVCGSHIEGSLGIVCPLRDMC